MLLGTGAVLCGKAGDARGISAGVDGTRGEMGRRKAGDSESLALSGRPRQPIVISNYYCTARQYIYHSIYCAIRRQL